MAVWEFPGRPFEHQPDTTGLLMFKVNKRDGKTCSFSHVDSNELVELEKCLNDKENVTGLSIHLFGTNFVFPSRTISDSDSIGFEVIKKPDGAISAIATWVHIKDTRTKMTVFCGGKSRMCRVDVARIGFRAGN